MDIQPTHIVYGIVAVIGLLGLAYLVGKLGRFGLIVLGIIVAGIFGLAMVQQSAATQRAAEAAEVAAVGQTASNLGLALALGVMLILLLLAVGLNLWQAWRFRSSKREKWTSGPNALWARASGDSSTPATTGAEMWAGPMMGQMMALQQMIVGLYTNDGDGRGRRPRTTRGARQNLDYVPLPFPSAAGGWEDWGDEGSWDIVEEQEEGDLWGVP
ncbi:MAG: hypothetical protein U9R15_18765 [Chloroflexota bacterium]|nr:hypothetical protein [Chloroflexota bacterium]